MRLLYRALVVVVLGAGWLLGQPIPNLYIVELTEAATPTPSLRRAAQARMERGWAGRHRVQARVDTVGNAFVVESSDRAGLEASAGVRRVTPVFRVKAHLDRALATHRITQGWERVGEPSRAGEGIKIAILDTGIDSSHPAFQATDRPVPAGYPKVSSDDFLPATSGKVIVQRSYDGMNRTPVAITDGAGHGTAVAMAAAGQRVRSPYGELSGAAPGAWLGAYRVFGGTNGNESTTATVLKAIDDAVADGMDVVNMSLGFSPPIREGLDPIASAVRRAAAMGVLVVKSVGNDGPDVASVDTPSVAGVGIAVGSIVNDRMLFQGVEVEGARSLLAVTSNGTRPSEPVRGKLVDVSQFDPTGLACNPLPGSSLQGVVALILRGSCNFSTKLKNAEAAGAMAAVVYTHALDPDPFTMDVEDARLPALMVGNESGLFLKEYLVTAPETQVGLNFQATVSFELTSPPLSEFSSKGPTVEGRISPDIVAVGEQLVTAAGRSNPRGSVYGASGYTIAQGTSFSAPLVAGAFAVLKQARPGLTMDQYRSLLINGASAFRGRSESVLAPQRAGAGKLDLLAAMTAPVTLRPATLNFGAGGVAGPQPIRVEVTEVSGQAARYSVQVEVGRGRAPRVEPAEFDLAAGGMSSLQVGFEGDFEPGEHFGALVVSGPEGQVTQRIPYWFGVATGKSTNITFLPYPPFSAPVGQTESLWFLSTDSAGLAATSEEPSVVVEEGGGSVVSVTRFEQQAPGLVRVEVRMGLRAGVENIFLIRCGEAQARAYIVGQ